MAATTTPRPAPTLTGRDFLLLLAAMVGTFTNYAPLLSVAPLWSAEGGAGSGGAGSATGMTMATTVGIQLFMPWLLRRFRLRTILAAGTVLLGAPTFGYLFSSAMGWVLAVSAVRGVGFGMVVVAGSALVAELVPASHRGRAVGWYGIAVGLPQVLFLPLGVWVAQHVGFAAVFVATGVSSLLALPLAMAISTLHPGAGRDDPAGGLRDDDERSGGEPRRPFGPGALRRLAGPWGVLIAAACALGGVTAFLPLTSDQAATAPAALFLMSAMVIAARWAAGQWSDKTGAGRLLVPSTVACAAGVGGFAWAAAAGSGELAISLAAAAAYGAGFGALQNDTLVVMFRRAGPSGNGAASTAWNLAYDAGTGIGAVSVGWGIQAIGVNGAFVATALLILAATPFARSTARPDKASTQEDRDRKQDSDEQHPTARRHSGQAPQQ